MKNLTEQQIEVVMNSMRYEKDKFKHLLKVFGKHYPDLTIKFYENEIKVREEIIQVLKEE
jgi:hypothetical protein